MAEYSDEELLELIREGSNSHYAFNLLVRKYQERIYHFVRRMVVIHEDADDVVQTVFIKVWQHIGDFRQDSRLYTWIYRIALNESLTFIKNRKIRSLMRLQGTEAMLLRSLEDDNYFSGDEIQKKLQAAILKLPRKQMIVFNMRYYDELSYEEMSKVLGTSVGALKASYHIAMKKIEESVTSN